MHALNQLLKHASSDNYYKGKSDIAGDGIFASKDLPVTTTVALALTPGDDDEYGSKVYNLTDAARFCNHQTKANCQIKKNEDGNFNIVTIKTVPQDKELTVDYRQVARAIGPGSRMQWEGKYVPNTDFSDYVEKEACKKGNNRG